LVDKKENLDPVVPEDEAMNDCGESLGGIIRSSCWTLDVVSYLSSLRVSLWPGNTNTRIEVKIDER
jgi:hypothetical protein